MAGQVLPTNHPGQPVSFANRPLNQPPDETQPGPGPTVLPGCARLPAPPEPAPGSPPVRIAVGRFFTWFAAGMVPDARSGEDP